MKAIKLLGFALAVTLLATVLVGEVMAQAQIPVPVIAGPVITAPASSSLFGNAFGKGIGAGLVLIGAAMGFGRIGAAALESMARQPETAGKVQTAMIIIGALLEGATFFALIVCITIAA